jgi:hypothetical protein
MENISMLLPLVKDLLSGIYNVSDIRGQKTLQTTPALTFFLEQVAQGGDKVKSTFKLTVGPSTVLAGDGPPAEPANLNTSSTCCDSALEGTCSPVLGPRKHPNISEETYSPILSRAKHPIISNDEALKPVPNLNNSSTCCESTMEGEVSPVLGPTKHNISLVEQNLFSSPTLSIQEPEISAIFRQEENTIQQSFDSISNPLAIDSSFSGLLNSACT